MEETNQSTVVAVSLIWKVLSFIFCIFLCLYIGYILLTFKQAIISKFAAQDNNNRKVANGSYIHFALVLF
jgi:hypothetical protein